MIEAQVHYVLQCLRELRPRGADYLDVDAGEQPRFNERVQQALNGTVWNSGCRSWYQSGGRPQFHHLAVVHVALLARDAQG